MPDARAPHAAHACNTPAEGPKVQPRAATPQGLGLDFGWRRVGSRARHGGKRASNKKLGRSTGLPTPQWEIEPMAASPGDLIGKICRKNGDIENSAVLLKAWESAPKLKNDLKGD